MVDSSTTRNRAAGHLAIPEQFPGQNQLYDRKHMVFNHCNSLPEHLWQRQSDAPCGLSCLAAGVAETELVAS